METFAFLLHPLSIDDVAKKYKIARKVSPKVVASVLKRRRPFVLSEVKGVRSLNGTEACGWFIAVPLLPNQFMELDEDYVVEKIVKACKLAKKKGAKIVGLGAFTAVVGDGGKKIAEAIDGVAITTGNTYTVATALEGTKRAASYMGIDFPSATLAVVGATGSIGRVSAKILAPSVKRVKLVGRNLKKLEKIKHEISKEAPYTLVEASSDISSSISSADIIITVTSAIDFVINPYDIKSGAVVCDVARPRDVSPQVARVRDDVLVIDGGVVKVPGNPDFGFDIGLPSGLAEACISETMILALEKRYENYSLGKELSLEKVYEIEKLAKKHGFEVAGLRRFEKAITEAQIEEIKRKAYKKLDNLKPSVKSQV